MALGVIAQLWDVWQQDGESFTNELVVAGVPGDPCALGRYYSPERFGVCVVVVKHGTPCPQQEFRRDVVRVTSGREPDGKKALALLGKFTVAAMWTKRRAWKQRRELLLKRRALRRARREGPWS